MSNVENKFPTPVMIVVVIGVLSLVYNLVSKFLEVGLPYADEAKYLTRLCLFLYLFYLIVKGIKKKRAVN